MEVTVFVDNPPLLAWKLIVDVDVNKVRGTNCVSTIARVANAAEAIPRACPGLRKKQVGPGHSFTKVGVFVSAMELGKNALEDIPCTRGAASIIKCIHTGIRMETRQGLAQTIENCDPAPSQEPACTRTLSVAHRRTGRFRGTCAVVHESTTD